jgi:hypothetical protein
MDFFGTQETILWYKNASKICFLYKTAFVKLKIKNNCNKSLMKHIQNSQKPCNKKIHTSLWILYLKKKIHEAKVSRLLPNVCDFQKENHTLGCVFKNQ